MFKNFKTTLYRNAPNLLSGAAICGFLTSTILAVRATPKAIDILESVDNLGETPKDRILNTTRLLFPIYAPSVGMFLISASMIIGSGRISRNRYIALNSLYSVTHKTLRDWQEKTLEVAGPKIHSDISDEVAKPSRPVDNLIIMGDEVLCYDIYSDRYFKTTSIELLRKSVNDLNDRMISEMFISINDLYYEFGLAPVGGGNDVGWSIEDGFISIDIRPVLSPENKPCVSFTFNVVPRYILS